LLVQTTVSLFILFKDDGGLLNIVKRKHIRLPWANFGSNQQASVISQWTEQTALSSGVFEANWSL